MPLEVVSSPANWWRMAANPEGRDLSDDAVPGALPLMVDGLARHPRIGPEGVSAEPFVLVPAAEALDSFVCSRRLPVG